MSLISWVILFVLVPFEVLSNHLSCYHCISQVPLDLVSQDAKDAFKQFMFAKFNVPPSHAQCEDSEAYEFSSVRTELCSTSSDHCVKTIVKENGFDFVMRGCLSSLYKSGYQLSTEVTCSPPSATCLCDTELCNIAFTLTLWPFLLILIINISS